MATSQHFRRGSFGDPPGPTTGYLEGQILLAMPAMTDPRFERAVIYLCAHSPEGAMGIAVNRLMDNLSFEGLLEQLSIDIDGPVKNVPVQVGGPVEPGRGFVLHTADFTQDSSLLVEGGEFALTATVDILRAIATGGGPRKSLLALGYANWGPGQLDAELQANVWLSCPADEDVLFGRELHRKWPLAMAKLGIDISMLSSEAGHA